jgi:hypothetical protein
MLMMSAYSCFARSHDIPPTNAEATVVIQPGGCINADSAPPFKTDLHCTTIGNGMSEDGIDRTRDSPLHNTVHRVPVEFARQDS